MQSSVSFRRRFFYQLEREPFYLMLINDKVFAPFYIEFLSSSGPNPGRKSPDNPI